MRSMTTAILSAIILACGATAAPSGLYADQLKQLNIPTAISPAPDAFDTVAVSQALGNGMSLNICTVDEDSAGATMYIAVDRADTEPDRHIIKLNKQTLTAMLYAAEGNLTGGIDVDYDSTTGEMILRYLTSDAVISARTDDAKDGPIDFSLTTADRQETIRMENSDNAERAGQLLDSLEAGTLERSELRQSERELIEKVETLRQWIDTVGLVELTNAGMGMFRGMSQGMMSPDPQSDNPVKRRAFGLMTTVENIFGMQPVM